MGSCRSQELRNLSLDDIEDNGHELSVSIRNLKTYYHRDFIIGGDWYPVVRRYMDLRPAEVSHNYFFVRFIDGRCTRMRMSLDSLKQIPQMIARYMGLDDFDRYVGYIFRFHNTT